MIKTKIPAPTESIEQINLFRWAVFAEGKYPALKLLHHIPNGGKRSVTTAIRLKSEGVRAGVPDLCLPVARGGYHGIYIELKRTSGGSLSEEQRAWLEALRQEGYFAVVCKGFEDASREILRYLEL